MFGAWIGIVAGIVVVVVGVWIFATRKNRGNYDFLPEKPSLWVGLASVVIGILIAGGAAFWLYGTEAGARAQKSWDSDTGGGLTRVVTVYDMEGDTVATYEGKFDVDANENRIMFDIPQSDGTYKRVQIWTGTGTTVTIVEK